MSGTGSLLPKFLDPPQEKGKKQSGYTRLS